MVMLRPANRDRPGPDSRRMRWVQRGYRLAAPRARASAQGGRDPVPVTFGDSGLGEAGIRGSHPRLSD